MANTIDLGDMNAPSTVGNIHPRNKSYVGERLARWVRHDVYHQQVEVNGPQPWFVEAHLVHPTELVVTVWFTGESRNQGIFALGTPDCVNATRYGCCSPLSNNTVSDGLLELTYVAANGSTVMVSGPVTTPTGPQANWLNMTLHHGLPQVGGWLQVAHAWQPFPGCALYNSQRLPALPFRLNITVQTGVAVTAPPVCRVPT